MDERSFIRESNDAMTKVICTLDDTNWGRKSAADLYDSLDELRLTIVDWQAHLITNQDRMSTPRNTRFVSADGDVADDHSNVYSGA